MSNLLRNRMRRLLVLAASLAAGFAHAHHSASMFDESKRVTVVGTVTEFQWTNPHTYIEMDVPEPQGGSTHYSFACASISILRQLGWKPSSLKVGDKVKMEFSPLRDGRPGGLMQAVTLPDGTVLEEAK